jgi:hypothetical protein
MALRWKVGTTGWDGRGVVCRKSTPPKLYPPPVSVKDRWVSPHEQVLSIPIACQWYGPDKPSSMSTDVWLSPLLHWLARERNWVWAHGSISWHAVDCVRSPFSHEQWLCPTLSTTHERLPRTGTTRRKRALSIRGLVWEAYVSYWSGFPLQGTHRFESPRLLGMSNHLFVTIFT